MTSKRALGVVGLLLALAASLAATWWLVGDSLGDGRAAARSTPVEGERLVPTLFSDTPPPAPTTLPPTTRAAVSPDNRWRLGVVDRLGDLASFDLRILNAGWFVSGMGDHQTEPEGEIVHIVGVESGVLLISPAALADRVAAQPGLVWQIGNEPDVIWQSNSTPEEYAAAYHQAYGIIKGADPGAQVAAGAISQPTPLRLAYLDLVLEVYRELYGEPIPVDVWAIHNAILREERGSWGVDIPPGIDQETGRLYEIRHNADLEIFRAHLVDFRTWMRDRNFRDRPLIITEFGVLMPAEYGFPFERVAAFMTGAFDLLSAVDKELGQPADGDRLVQRWAWYSIAAIDYPTGNLFDPHTGQMTALGEVFSTYAIRD